VLLQSQFWGNHYLYLALIAHKYFVMHLFRNILELPCLLHR
jgi:hypothetical protein